MSFMIFFVHYFMSLKQVVNGVLSHMIIQNGVMYIVTLYNGAGNIQ